MTPPRLPSHIHVGPLSYEVTQDRTAWLEAAVREGSEVYGTTDHAKCLIVVDPKQVLGQRRDTLLHETLHCLTEITGLASELGPDNDERLVRRLTPMLLDVLRNNPRLVAYLMAT